MKSQVDSRVLQVIELTLQNLAEIKDVSIDSETMELVTFKVLDAIEMKPPKQYTPGSTSGIIECIKQCGGCASRAEITLNTGMNPNVISSLLNKLVKQNKVYKVPLEQPSFNRKGRGHIAEYGYQLAEINSDKKCVNPKNREAKARNKAKTTRRIG